MSPRIEILFFDGCPNHPPTLEIVRSVVQSLGVDATIREVEVRSAAEAERLRFLGSPTVHVDGQDVDPEARGRVDYSFSCRMYGHSGPPLRELVERALQAHRPRVAERRSA